MLFCMQEEMGIVVSVRMRKGFTFCRVGVFFSRERDFFLFFRVGIYGGGVIVLRGGFRRWDEGNV